MKEKKLICADCNYALIFKKDCISYKCTVERLIKSEVWLAEDQKHLVACPYYDPKKIKTNKWYSCSLCNGTGKIGR